MEFRIVSQLAQSAVSPPPVVDKRGNGKGGEMGKDTLVIAGGPTPGGAFMLGESSFSERYEKLRVIGSGSYGSAWLVRRTPDSLQREKDIAGKATTDPSRRYVAKEIVCDVDGDAKRTRRRMERAGTEVRVLQRLRHPNIIKYVDEFEEWDRQWIVMEYATGGDLKKLIRKRRERPVGDGGPFYFDETTILAWFAQLIVALKYIHSCRLLHRDIKPANLFLNSDHTVLKVGDFGLTKQLAGTAEQANTVCGTPMNFAPELCQENPYTSKADIWAAGCVLFELMTLEHPFNRGESKVEIFKKILSGTIPNPNPKRMYSADLVALVTELLQQDPLRRPSASDVVVRPIVTAALLRLDPKSERRRSSTEKQQGNANRTDSQHGGGSGTTPMARPPAVIRTQPPLPIKLPTSAPLPQARTPSSAPRNSGWLQQHFQPISSSGSSTHVARRAHSSHLPHHVTPIGSSASRLPSVSRVPEPIALQSLPLSPTGLGVGVDGSDSRRTTPASTPSKGTTPSAMSLSELDLWITKNVADATKRRLIRQELALLAEANARPSPRGSTKSREVAPEMSPRSMHQRCDIFDRIVEHIGTVNEAVYVTLLAIVFGQPVGA